MKCEPCGFQQKPDNMQRLMTHLESCGKTDLEKMKLVWRNSELTVTYEKKKSETEFFDRPRILESAPEPEIMIPILKINAHQVGKNGEPIV